MRDAYEGLAMSVFVFALLWFGASHGIAHAPGSRPGAGELSMAASDPAPRDRRWLPIASHHPDAADTAASPGDWVEVWAMP